MMTDYVKFIILTEQNNLWLMSDLPLTPGESELALRCQVYSPQR